MFVQKQDCCLSAKHFLMSRAYQLTATQPAFGWVVLSDQRYGPIFELIALIHTHTRTVKEDGKKRHSPIQARTHSSGTLVPQSRTRTAMTFHSPSTLLSRRWSDGSVF